MILKVFENYPAMSASAADVIVECLRRKPESLICFATGDTPRLAYEILVEKIRTAKVDGSKFSLIGLDEWLGITHDNPGSCHHFLHHYLIQPLSMSAWRVHLFNGMSLNTEEECNKMNRLLYERGPIDLMVVGVGMNGHIGFNEPGESLESEAHVAILDETTRTVGLKYFDQDVTINKGITLGLKQVADARTLLMIANGKNKASIMRQVLEEEITNDIPASLVRTHQNGIVLIDREAAFQLENQS